MAFHFHPNNSHHRSPPSHAQGPWEALLAAPWKGSTPTAAPWAGLPWEQECLAPRAPSVIGPPLPHRGLQARALEGREAVRSRGPSELSPVRLELNSSTSRWMDILPEQKPWPTSLGLCLAGRPRQVLLLSLLPTVSAAWVLGAPLSRPPLRPGHVRERPTATVTCGAWEQLTGAGKACLVTVLVRSAGRQAAFKPRLPDLVLGAGEEARRREGRAERQRMPWVLWPGRVLCRDRCGGLGSAVPAPVLRGSGSPPTGGGPVPV